MIPARLLIHECVLKKRAGLDRNRNPVYEKIVLKRARFGAKFETGRNNIGAVKADSLTLFIDAKNTRFETADGEKTACRAVAAVIPQEQDSIEWNGKSYDVKSVTPIFTQGTAEIHHWEISLE